MIATSVRLHDVKCAESFVAACMHKSRIRFTPHDREELLAEGLCIMAELAERYEPHRDGYAQAGSFSGYAAYLLPKRLEDAYHRLHPEHLRSRQEDGRRVFEYGKHAMSLHADDMPELVASAFLGPLPEDDLPSCPTMAIASLVWEPPPMIAAALCRVPAEFQVGAAGVVKCIDAGLGTDEIARTLRLDRRDVSRIQGAVGSAVFEVLQEAA